MLSPISILDSLTLKGNYYIFLLLFILVQYLWTRYRPGLRNVPGPLLASLSNFWRIGGVLSQDMPWRNIAVHEKYGPLVRIGPNHVSTSDPQALKMIYNFTNIFRKVHESTQKIARFLFPPKENNSDTISRLSSQLARGCTRERSCQLFLLLKAMSTMLASNERQRRHSP